MTTTQEPELRPAARVRRKSPRGAGPSANLTKYGHMEAQLEKYKQSTLTALLSYVPPEGPRRHLYDLVSDYPQRGGKGFRPGLCLATCSAFGGDPELAQRSAVALELLHNAFLVHDDVEDGSTTRRGKPTMHEREGVPIAINVGDAMNVLSLRPLMENVRYLGAQLAFRVMQEVEHMVRESVEGQAMELGWVRDNVCDLGDRDYLQLVLKKTCWYTCIHPMRIGALIASGGTIDPNRFNRFGYYVGAAFQIQDDILNLVGEESRYGKEIGGDILEGKRTLILVHLLRSASKSEKRLLVDFLAKPRAARLPAELDQIMRLLRAHGSIEYARACAKQLAGAALKEFHGLYGSLPPSNDRQAIEDLVMYMVERDL
jgi:geranylgeranyl diphosphate synthase, type II